MGFLARLLSFDHIERDGVQSTDAKVDMGGAVVGTMQHLSAPGDDSAPLVGDYVASVSVSHTGGGVAVGYCDPAFAPMAEPGDKRIYSRDADSGEMAAQLWLHADKAIAANNENGSALIDPDGNISFSNEYGAISLSSDGKISIGNDSGSIELNADGSVNINGATIDAAGAITAPTMTAETSLKAAGLELAGHIHAAGEPPGTTGPNQ